MIQIEDNVSMPPMDDATVQAWLKTAGIKIENVPMPSEAKAAKITMDKGLRKIVGRYNEAHMKVYGMPATVSYEKPWLRVSGIDSRVSRQRLLEMARQLEYRIGE